MPAEISKPRQAETHKELAVSAKQGMMQISGVSQPSSLESLRAKSSAQDGGKPKQSENTVHESKEESKPKVEPPQSITPVKGKTVTQPKPALMMGKELAQAGPPQRRSHNLLQKHNKRRNLESQRRDHDHIV